MSHTIETAPGVRLHVQDLGEGTPVVLLHGWPVSHEMFEYQLDRLLEQGYRAIAVDFRGYGKSDRPAAGYDYDTMADDVCAVLDALDVEDAALLGFSMGGAIALRYMARHDQARVAKLALVSAAVPSFTQRDAFPYGLEASAVDEFITAGLTDRPALLEQFGGMFFDEDTELSEPFKAWFHSLALQASGHSTIASLVALRDEDLRDDLAAVTVPTSIFHGANDQICPIDIAEQTNTGIVGSELVRFTSSGHGLFYDELETFNEELLAFLAP